MSRVSWSLKEGGLDALLIAVVASALTVVGVWLPPPLHQTYLVGLLGSILGAILGLLSSPYNSGDKALFKGYEKLIYGFFSGWLLSRVNTFLDKEEHVTLLLQAPFLPSRGLLPVLVLPRRPLHLRLPAILLAGLARDQGAE